MSKKAKCGGPIGDAELIIHTANILTKQTNNEYQNLEIGFLTHFPQVLVQACFAGHNYETHDKIHNQEKQNAHPDQRNIEWTIQTQTLD